MKKDPQTKKKLLRSPLLWGVLTSLLLTGVALLLPEYPLFGKGTGIIGGLCLFASLILSGSLVSGDRARANYAYESRDDRISRNKAAHVLLLFGLPHFLLFMLPYLLE